MHTHTVYFAAEKDLALDPARLLGHDLYLCESKKVAKDYARERGLQAYSIRVSSTGSKSDAINVAIAMIARRANLTRVYSSAGEWQIEKVD